MSALLKLKAKDAEDLQVISAVLQDAIAPVCDMVYRDTDRNFVLVVQRLCREQQGELNRICCAVNLDNITLTQLKGFEQQDKARMLDLLAILPDEEGVQFVFAGGARLRFTGADWALHIEDFGETWPAACSPCHDDETGQKTEKLDAGQ
ncbi:MAG: DUF2948 family protein [Alphaproteobacteria bacterium]|nr:DUF2948 family protein [Alphaproteobacteria bacterium]MBV8548345.1 DUF2948 family protein [Alphaproteobacteria bacterium]